MAIGYIFIKEKSYIVCIKKVQEIVYLPVLFIYFSLIYFLQYIYMWMEFILFDILLVNKTLLHYICSVNANHDTILFPKKESSRSWSYGSWIYNYVYAA
jgi:hypothetical protein